MVDLNSLLLLLLQKSSQIVNINRCRHNGKNLLNIKRIPALKHYSSVHHVSSMCPDPNKMRTVNHVKKSLVRVHHYLGSQEQYFFRSDPRERPSNNTSTKKGVTNVAYFTRTRGRYSALSRVANYPDHGARAWIKGFIQKVGMEKAKELLNGVGQVGYEGEPSELNWMSP